MIRDFPDEASANPKGVYDSKQNLAKGEGAILCLLKSVNRLFPFQQLGFKGQWLLYFPRSKQLFNSLLWEMQTSLRVWTG